MVKIPELINVIHISKVKKKDIMMISVDAKRVNTTKTGKLDISTSTSMVPLSYMVQGPATTKGFFLAKDIRISPYFLIVAYETILQLSQSNTFNR